MLREVSLSPGVVLVLSDALTNPFGACFELNSEGFAERCHVSLRKSWNGAVNQLLLSSGLELPLDQRPVWVCLTVFEQVLPRPF